MRIVLVNWARIWDGAAHGGGVNGYCQALAMELVRLGHDVVWLCGGTTFYPDRPAPGPLSADGLPPGPPEIRRHHDWFGIRVFEVINSPVVAPSLLQFADPVGEIADAELESCLSRWLALVGPDVVHFHNIEGFTAGCVAAVRDCPSRPVVLFSLHNYHTICPQVYLMQGHRRPCTCFDAGHACVGCVEAIDPAHERRLRARLSIAAPERAPEDGVPVPSPHLAPPRDQASRRPILRGLGSGIRSLIRPSARPGAARDIPSAAEAFAPPPGRAVRTERDAVDALAPDEPDTRGRSQMLAQENSFRFLFTPEAPEWAPVSNTSSPEPKSDLEPTPYAQRREAMVRMLNTCDRVLAVSRFVRDKFVAMGVERDRIASLPIGSRINRVVRTNAELVFEPPPFDPDDPRPIRLVFMGYNNWYKGLPMLADALELLTPELLARFHLFVYALDGQTIEWRFRRLEPRLGGLTMNHGYEYRDIPWICGGKDLGLVTSVWWDNAPQTVFEFFACGVPVLGANLGGIPDFVHDGVNGLLFRGNDRFDLARRLAQIASDPTQLTRLRRGVRPPKDIAEHAVEMESLYADCLCSGRGRHREKLPTPIPVVPRPRDAAPTPAVNPEH